MDSNCSTTVFVEGDATVKSYEDANGVSRTALNIAQRTYTHH